MTKIQKNNYSKYQLRHAADQYYLLDMEQTGFPYKRPMELNFIGAQIWGMMSEGLAVNNMAQILSKEYQMPIEEIREDILQFQNSLAAYGVIIEG